MMYKDINRIFGKPKYIFSEINYYCKFKKHYGIKNKIEDYLWASVCVLGENVVEMGASV